jgi:hypothetical protein
MRKLDGVTKSWMVTADVDLVISFWEKLSMDLNK